MLPTDVTPCWCDNVGKEKDFVASGNAGDELPDSGDGSAFCDNSNLVIKDDLKPENEIEKMQDCGTCSPDRASDKDNVPDSKTSSSLAGTDEQSITADNIILGGTSTASVGCSVSSTGGQVFSINCE